jgi:hypothetical protein
MESARTVKVIGLFNQRKNSKERKAFNKKNRKYLLRYS